MNLNLETLYQVLLPPADTFHILLAGVGGTGSWLAVSLGRLMYHAQQKGKQLHLTLVDPDVVTAANCGRQLFCPAEIGTNKAATLAQRLNQAWGLQITAVSTPYTAPMGQQWARGSNERANYLLIGCVDNHLARRELAETTQNQRGRVWAIDCGNARANGQVLIGNLNHPTHLEVNELGLCNGFLSPYLQEPGLLEPDPQPNTLSCADLALREEQSLMVNAQTAAIAAQYVYDFILRRSLHTYASYFTLEPPTTVSHKLTVSRIHVNK